MAKKIYIAGPMTGIPEFNYPAFHKAEEYLTALGYECVNPATLSEPLGMKAEWEIYMRNSLKHLLDCDAIAMLEGFRKSRGAVIEFELAVALKMDIKCFHEGKLL